MYKITLLLVLMLIVSACSNDRPKEMSKDSSPATSTTQTITVTQSSNESSTNNNKENRDFAFALINTRQQFKDIGSIGISALRNYVDKKINKDEFLRKIEEMNTQLNAVYQKLENEKTSSDSNLQSIYGDMKKFLSEYYLDLLYNSLKAEANGDTKTFQNLMDRSKTLEGTNRELDKKLSDLKIQYNLQ